MLSETHQHRHDRRGRRRKQAQTQEGDDTNEPTNVFNDAPTPQCSGADRRLSGIDRLSPPAALADRDTATSPTTPPTTTTVTPYKRDVIGLTTTSTQQRSPQLNQAGGKQLISPPSSSFGSFPANSPGESPDSVMFEFMATVPNKTDNCMELSSPTFDSRKNKPFRSRPLSSLDAMSQSSPRKATSPRHGKKSVAYTNKAFALQREDSVKSLEDFISTSFLPFEVSEESSSWGSAKFEVAYNVEGDGDDDDEDDSGLSSDYELAPTAVNISSFVPAKLSPSDTNEGNNNDSSKTFPSLEKEISKVSCGSSEEEEDSYASPNVDPSELQPTSELTLDFYPTSERTLRCKSSSTSSSRSDDSSSVILTEESPSRTSNTMMQSSAYSYASLNIDPSQSQPTSELTLDLHPTSDLTPRSKSISTSSSKDADYSALLIKSPTRITPNKMMRRYAYSEAQPTQDMTPRSKSSSTSSSKDADSSALLIKSPTRTTPTKMMMTLTEQSYAHSPASSKCTVGSNSSLVGQNLIHSPKSSSTSSYKDADSSALLIKSPTRTPTKMMTRLTEQSYADSPASSKRTVGSNSSLVGQHLLIYSPNSSARDIFGDLLEDLSMDYSETENSYGNGSLSSHLNANKSIIASQVPTPRTSRTSEAAEVVHIVTTTSRRRIATTGSVSGSSTSSSLSSRSSQYSRSSKYSRHSHKKPRRGSYDGAMLDLVEQMHGSGSTIEHMHDSMTVSQDSSRRLSAVAIATAIDRAVDYVSSTSGSVSTRDLEEPLLVAIKKQQQQTKQQRRHSVGDTKQPHKASRRGSTGSGDGTDGTGEPHQQHHKTSRRGSMGSGGAGEQPQQNQKKTSRRGSTGRGGAGEYPHQHQHKKVSRRGSTGSGAAGEHPHQHQHQKSSRRVSKGSGAAGENQHQKSPRRRSMGSTSSESSDGRKEILKGGHKKQPRRHSLGTPVPTKPRGLRRRGSMGSSSSPATPVPTRPRGLRRRGSMGSSSSSADSSSSASSGERSKSNFSSHRRRLLEHGPGSQYLVRRSSGYFSACSSEEAGSLSSVSTNMSREDAKSLMDTLDGKKISSQLSPRLTRSASPVATAHRLKLEDLGQMRYSAPPRLDRMQSRRRRSLLMLGQPHLDRSASPRSSTERLSISKLVDHLAIDNLEDFNLSGSSLPPLHPPASPSGSSRRKSSASMGRPPVDPRGKTVRISNRSIDILPESMLPKNRRFSTSSRPRHCIGAPLLFGDSHSLSSDSSGSSSTSSM
jgi:hypothetical protein